MQQQEQEEEHLRIEDEEAETIRFKIAKKRSKKNVFFSLTPKKQKLLHTGTTGS